MPVPSVSIALAIAFLLNAAISSLPARASEIETAIQGAAIVLPPTAEEALQEWVQGTDPNQPVLKQPTEVVSILNALSSCDVVLDGWDKKAFLQEWAAAEDDLAQRLARLVNDGRSLKGGPLISQGLAADMIADDKGYPTLPPKLLGILEEFEDAREDVSLTITEGTDGLWVRDPSVTQEAVPSGDQIGIAAERFIRISLPRLYERLLTTPSRCYSLDLLPQVHSLIKSASDTKTLVAKIFEKDDLVEIECGKVGTYSRFRIPIDTLGDQVREALKTGPSPFGPAGLYFSRDWFFTNAAWQMYARERGDYYNNLSPDVADYTCGKP
ncbi:hypothetical protein [Rhizobium sp. BK251]|uniref:hypothetical protein n=1 Tax=Rhizobium sp. BK251 TaxID=2512125 RepID=UPI00104BC78E|nr:hypothetical protein [Rhizobium sp. BK251]TCL64132.1 hypothetical protein EV286_11567 [Rhizobium sp. BK251]